MQIREIDSNSSFEIELVARRMRETLQEVIGAERGEALYSMEWLIHRVRWHLDSSQTKGRVFLLKKSSGEIIGHAIARVDPGVDFGLFSTLFVEPGSRKQGLAQLLISHVEAWFRTCDVQKIVYNTAVNHKVLIRLFERNDFSIRLTEAEMVQMEKPLDGNEL